MKRLLILFVVLAVISAMALSGCKGSTGDTGAQGPAGSTGATGPQGPTLPSVSFMSPGQSDTNVPLDSVIRVSFTKDMLASSVTATANFTVTCEGVSIPGTISYNSGSKTAYFDPADGLPAFSYITVTLTSGMQDTQANALPQYTASFYTDGSFAPSRLYVLNNLGNSVTVYNNAGAADGSVFPDRIITNNTGTVLNAPNNLWLDSASDRLYVTNYWSSSISVYNNISGLNGPNDPDRVISGPTTSLTYPRGIWLDSANDRLYVANDGTKTGIFVFESASMINGDVAPSRVITSATSTLTWPRGIWLDSTADRLYVASAFTNAIVVYDQVSTANGDTQPSRIISGPSTTLAGPRGVWLDSSSDTLYVASYGNNKIVIFDNASTANGNQTPARIISGTSTALSTPVGVRYDAATDRLYVTNAGAGKYSILVFNNASTINGDVAPSRNISGANTDLNSPAGLWLDTNP